MDVDGFLRHVSPPCIMHHKESSFSEQFPCYSYLYNQMDQTYKNHNPDCGLLNGCDVKAGATMASETKPDYQRHHWHISIFNKLNFFRCHSEFTSAMFIHEDDNVYEFDMRGLHRIRNRVGHRHHRLPQSLILKCDKLD